MTEPGRTLPSGVRSGTLLRESPMNSVASAQPSLFPEADLGGGRRLGDKTFRVVALVAGLSVLAILVLIAYSTTKEAWPIFRDDAGEFLFSTRWAPSEGKFGALAFVFGTVVTSAIALVFAVPLSVGIALFMT